jgi:hypothetical protein
MEMGGGGLNKVRGFVKCSSVLSGFHSPARCVCSSQLEYKLGTSSGYEGWGII